MSKVITEIFQRQLKNMSSEKKSINAKAKSKSSNSEVAQPEVIHAEVSTNTSGNTLVSDTTSKKAIGLSIALSVLSNILTDLIKPDAGWAVAINKVGELLQSLPFANFITLAEQNTSKKQTVEDYNLWLSSLLTTIAYFQTKSSELREIRDEFEISHEDIASLASKRIFESAGVNHGLDYFELKRMINSYFLYQYLQASIPPDLAKKVGKKMKI